MFAGNNPSDTLAALKNISALPEIIWELFLGVYCTIWGFRRESPILSGDAAPVAPAGAPALAPSA